MTAFTDIYDRALVTMQDYTLDKLAETNYDAFLLFMKSLLKSGIPFFNCCLNSLEFEDIEETEIDEDGNESQVTNTYFVADLTNKEQSILAMVLVYEWFKRDVNDARQYRQKLSTRDFKTESSYQSLQKRSEYLDKMPDVKAISMVKISGNGYELGFDEYVLGVLSIVTASCLYWLPLLPLSCIQQQIASPS